jgi:hypothetical protein
MAGVARDHRFAEARSKAGFYWSMIFSDLPSPAEASSQTIDTAKGFAQAGSRYPLFGMMF